MSETSRRELLGLSGGALWVGLAAACGAGSRRATSPAAGAGAGAGAASDERGFLMFQITDTHWGYKGPANPDPIAAFERAVTEIARWPTRPALVVHTGDVTHMTGDAGERKARLEAAKALLARLGTELLVIPGEHDAAADHGAAFQAVFGPTHQARELKGVSLIALDNVSDPKGGLGDEQLAWLDREVGKVPDDRPLLVFAHRPLFVLAQPWDWFTQDGERALAILDRHPRTTVFYGHIHQAHAHRAGKILHIATRSLVFPLPAPMSQPAKAPIPWDESAVDHGLGYRGIALEGSQPTWVERALVG
ncbi:MAG TPA: metallophosphoesterase [Kofleriaceae bacterium]|nr:metallophosphoesterase [Kofleriaceae bacterium]